MKAVTPADFTNRQVSPLTPLCRPGIPTSTTQAAHRSLCQSPQRRQLLPGFATHEQARHSITPNQVRHPTDCRFTSGCSRPRLARRSYLRLRSQRPAPTRTCTVLTKASSRSALMPPEARGRENYPLLSHRRSTKPWQRPSPSEMPERCRRLGNGPRNWCGCSNRMTF